VTKSAAQPGVRDLRQEQQRDRVHRRQFVLGPEPLCMDENWRSVQVAQSRYLSVCRTLPLAATRREDGGHVYLLGNALQTDTTKPRPLEQLNQSHGAAVSDLYPDWCGRWVLLDESSVHPDAGALLGCYYRTLEGPDGPETWISSSPAILRALPGREEPSEGGGQLVHATGMDWFPPPRSRYREIRRLLPSQTLEFSGAAASVLPRRLITDDLAGAEYDDLLDFLEARLAGAMAAVAAEPGQLWLPLTAGFDSRLLLALAERAVSPLTAYTFDKAAALISRADRVLPPQLAALTGNEHRTIPRRPFSEGRARAFDFHTAGHTVDIDREYLARGQWDQIPADALILRGGVFEVGRAYYYRKLPFDEFGDPDEAYTRIAGAFRFDSVHADSTSHAEGLRDWISWCLQEPEPLMDWRDRFYLEQRVAGWLAPIEQALDLTLPERVHLANATATISALAALPLEARRRTQHHVDLIRRSAPQLLRYGFNPPDSARQAVIGKARSALRRLKRIGRRFTGPRTAT
jgi:hypothetical protein